MATNTTHQVLVTADDKGPIIAIAIWFPMVVMILSVVIRLAIKLGVRKGLGNEDYTIIAALLFGIGQCIAVSVAVQNGLGKREDNLEASQLLQVERDYYAADLLYILTIGLAKISILQLLGTLAVKEFHKKATSISIITTIVWMIPSFFVLAFQCGVPTPWAVTSGQCINRLAFWIAISPVDLILDLIVVFLPVSMMWDVHVARGKKAVVIVAFGFRLCVVTATITRLCYLAPYFASSDVTFDAVDSSVITQVLLSTSIITACVPALKPILDAFDSGMMNVKIRGAGSNNDSQGNAYELQRSMNGTRPGCLSRNADDRNTGTGFITSINVDKSRARVREQGSIDSGNSDAMIIKRTDEWNVQYADKAPSLEPEKDAASF